MVKPVVVPVVIDTNPVRFHLKTPIQVGAIGRLNNVIGGGAAARLNTYSNQTFLHADLEAGVPLCTSELSHTGSLNLGYAFPLGTETSLQPFLGARALVVGSNWLPGVNYGVIGYYQPQSMFDFFTILRGTSAMSGTWGNAAIGTDINLMPGLALTLETAYGLIPNTLNAPTGTPFGTDSAVTGTVGLSVAL